VEPMINQAGRHFSPQFNAAPIHAKAGSWWPNKDARRSRQIAVGEPGAVPVWRPRSPQGLPAFSYRAVLRDPGPCSKQRRGAARSAPAIRSVASKHGIRARIGFLQLHAPVFQFFERDGRAGDRTPYKSPGLDDAEIPVEVLDLRLPGHGRRSIKTIEHVGLLHNRCSKEFFSLEHGGDRSLRLTADAAHRGGVVRWVLTGPSGPQPQ
jgi:hypothetical protein